MLQVVVEVEHSAVWIKTQREEVDRVKLMARVLVVWSLQVNGSSLLQELVHLLIINFTEVSKTIFKSLFSVKVRRL